MMLLAHRAHSKSLSGWYSPRKTDFLAHSGFLVTADLLGNNAVWLEMIAKVLRKGILKLAHRQCSIGSWFAYRFGPVNRKVGTVDIG